MLKRSTSVWVCWLSIFAALATAVVSLIAYMVIHESYVVMDAYCAETASLAIVDYVEKHGKVPASWQDLRPSIKRICSEVTGQQEQRIERRLTIDFVALSQYRSVKDNRDFITSPTGGRLQHPDPNTRIADFLLSLSTQSRTPGDGQER